MNYKGKRTKTDLMNSIVDDAALKSTRKVYNNTLEYELINGGFGIQLHDTEILRSNEDGQIILSSGGYKTSTTKTRLNHYLSEFNTGFVIYQEKGIWYLAKLPWNDDHNSVFEDGITLTMNFEIGKYIVSNSGGNAKDILRLQAKILKYSKGYTMAFIDGKIEPPSGGDCWMCLMVGTDGQAMGGIDHLKSHIREKYYVPSLLVNVIKNHSGLISEVCKWVVAEKWGQNPNDCSQFYDIAARQIQSAIKRYLRQQFGLAQ